MRTPTAGRQERVVPRPLARSVYTTGVAPEEVAPFDARVVRFVSERALSAPPAPASERDEDGVGLVAAGMWPTPEQPILVPVARPGDEAEAVLGLHAL